MRIFVCTLPKLISKPCFLTIMGLLVSASSAASAQPLPQFRLDNPCGAAQACEYEEVTIDTPLAENLSPDAATKGLNDCLVRSAPTCRRQNTQVTKVFILKKDRAAFQSGRVTRVVSSTSSTQITTTEQAVRLPVAGQPLDANHYDGLRFGWFHTNGAPVNADHKFRTGEKFNLFFNSNRGGYIYVVNVDSAGTQTLLYPDARRSSERSLVSANSRVTIDTQFVGIPGIERVYAVFSRMPVASLNELVAVMHRGFDGRPVDQMRLQAGTFNQLGEVSSNGILLSQTLQPASKGMMALSSSVQTSRATPTLETGAVLLIDPLITLQHPYSVMAIDLIHISR